MTSVTMSKMQCLINIYSLQINAATSDVDLMSEDSGQIRRGF